MNTEPTTPSTKEPVDKDAIVGLIAPALVVVVVAVLAINTALGRWSDKTDATKVQDAQATLTTAVSAPPAYTAPTTAAPVVTTPPTTAAPAPTTAAPKSAPAPAAAPVKAASTNVVVVRGITLDNCPHPDPAGVKTVNDYMGPVGPDSARKLVCKP